jgi:hypothetical protein
MVYEFILFSSVVEGRVIICSVSVVLRLEILVDIPYLAGSVVVARDVTIPLLPLYPHIPLEGLVGFKYPGQASSVVSLFHRYIPIDQ